MRSDMLGTTLWLGSGSVSSWGSYSRLPDRISWSSCWRASLSWSLVVVRSVCLSTPRCTEESAVRKMTDTMTIKDMLTVTSTRVMPSWERKGRRLSSLCTAGGRLVGGLSPSRTEVHLHGHGGDRRAVVGEDVGDLPNDRRFDDRGRLVACAGGSTG